jgi:hypothetical protein
MRKFYIFVIIVNLLCTHSQLNPSKCKRLYFNFVFKLPLILAYKGVSLQAIIYGKNIKITSRLIKACECDLISNYCDLLCCCDTSCTEDDFQAFSCKENQTEM